jgi:dihydrolipoamide dehydrogenase
MKYDVCVIGAGPGGYVAAIRAGQLGLKVAIIEREYMGGVCLNVGCIPSKAMISAAKFFDQTKNGHGTDMGITVGSVSVDLPKLKTWKQSVSDKMAGGVEQLLKGNGVEIIRGEAEFKDAKTLMVGEKQVEADNYIIATGSRPIELPAFKYDEETVMSSTGALDLEKLPKKLVVIGGGYIGLEISFYLKKLGTEVVVLEASDKLLGGICDEEVHKQLQRSVKKTGIEVNYKAFAKSWKKAGKGVEVTAEVNGKSETFKADKILVTVGRLPNSDQMNLKEIGLEIDDRGFVTVDAQRRTNLPGIWCIGDLACQPMLAHKASHEGVLVAEVISGQNRVFDAKTVPAVIFTSPEIASVGVTEEEAKESGREYITGKFPFGANGKAVSLQETEGFVKMIADKETHALMGVHIIGPQASNLISEAALAMEMGATLEDLALTIHPHPTLGETLMECAEVTLGHGIHVMAPKKRPSRAQEANA